MAVVVMVIVGYVVAAVVAGIQCNVVVGWTYGTMVVDGLLLPITIPVGRDSGGCVDDDDVVVVFAGCGIFTIRPKISTYESTGIFHNSNFILKILYLISF